MLLRNNQNTKTDLAILSIATVISALLVGVCLYHSLTIGVGTDYPTHIKIAQEGKSYSLVGIIFSIIMSIARPAPLVACSLFFGFCVAGSIPLTWLVLQQIGMTGWAACSASICLNYVIALWIPLSGQYWYLGTFTGNLYHNPTYTLMRPFTLLCFWLYLCIRKHPYLKDLTPLRWICFTCCLTLATFSKPSFFTILAPIMLLDLIIDFVKSRGRNIFREIAFGTSVFPALGICLFQSNVLYADHSNGIAFQPFVAFAGVGGTGISIFRSMIFPLAVLFLCRTEGTPWWYKFGWGMYLCGALQALCLTEIGPRAGDGNFFWSAHIGIFFLNLVSLAYYWKFTHTTNNNPKSISAKIKVIVPASVFVLCIISGMYYLLKFCMQGSFLI